MDATDYLFIQQEFKLHPSTVVDCMQCSGLEKAEIYSHYLYCSSYEVLKGNSESPENTCNINFVVMPNCLLTFHSRTLDCILNIVEKLHLCKAQYKTPDWLVFCFLDFTTVSLINDMQNFFIDVEALDLDINGVNVKDRPDLPELLAVAKQNFLKFQILLAAKTKFLTSLLSKDKVLNYLTKQTRSKLKEVLDGAKYMVIELNIYKEVLSSIHINQKGVVYRKSTNTILLLVACGIMILLCFIVGVRMHVPYMFMILHVIFPTQFIVNVFMVIVYIIAIFILFKM